MSALNAFEIEIIAFVRGMFSGPILDAAACAFSWLGDGGRCVVALALVLLCIKRTRIYGAILATALIFDLLAVNIALKPLVARVRPYNFSGLPDIIIAPPSGYSFPSGHTAVAFAAAGALSVCGKNAHTAALAFAVLMGFSRIYLAVHYPTDVLAGAVAGSLCGWLAVYVWKCLGKKTYGLGNN